MSRGLGSASLNQKSQHRYLVSKSSSVIDMKPQLLSSEAQKRCTLLVL